MRATEIARNDWILEFPPPRSLPLDQEALQIFERAYAIGQTTEGSDEPPISFTVLAIALLSGTDETSQWFATEAKVNGPLRSEVLKEKNLSENVLSSISADPGRPADPRLSDDKQLLTLSAQSVLGTAEEWATRVGSADIGVRHLVASYVLNPPAAHRKQMDTWGFGERRWRDGAFKWVAARYTAEPWTDASSKVTPTKAIPAYERPEVKGKAIAFPGDDAVMAILDRAAEYHARRTDTSLQLQTVLHALIDQTLDHPELRKPLAPIEAAVSGVRPAYDAAVEAFKGKGKTDKARAKVPFDELNISPRVLNALETARELAATLKQVNDDRVGVLILAGALISHRVDADEYLAGMHLAPQELRRAVIDHADPHREAGDTWQEALGEQDTLPTGRSIELNSDDPEAVIRAENLLDEKWTNDPLDIRGDVNSFATLLASTTLEPPLSIGLFGPWGAGKTTFLKRLRMAIDSLTKEGRDARGKGMKPTSVGQVVHIEFNAWHFAETALISSLLDTIVRALQTYIRNDEVPVGKALQTLKSETAERLRRRQETATQMKATADTAVTAATGRLTQKQTEAGQKAVGLNQALNVVWTTALNTAKESKVLKDSGLLDRFQETVTGIDDLRSRIEKARTRPARLLGDLGWARTLIFAGLILVVPPLVVLYVRQRLASVGLSQGVVTFSAALSVLGVWLKSASSAVSKVDTALAKLAKTYEDAITAAPAVQKAQQEFDTAVKDAAAAAAELTAAQSALQQAEAELAAASLPSQVLNLVSGRVADRSYAQELTTISAARGDLQLLSQLLREQAAAPPVPGGVTPVERVVLYIDDLDRCKPEDVVRVLQVVHMLLAFELFVVVVAVDARWVNELLKQSYRWLQTAKPEPGSSASEAGSRANDTLITPQDYLEKIFQVSFWLEPMTAARAADYLKSLVRAPQSEYERSGDAVPHGDQTSTRRIDIVAEELDYMRALAAHFGPSPRRVKRLVNAYRLIKARLSDAQLRQFIDRKTANGSAQSGPYQLVIGLLVIGTGASASAAEILATLAQRDPRDHLDTVITEFRARQHPDWLVAAQVLEMVRRTQKSADLSELRISELRGWAGKVGRFLLQGSPDLPRVVRVETPQP